MTSSADRDRRTDAVRDVQDTARDGGPGIGVLLDKRRYRGGPAA